MINSIDKITITDRFIYSLINSYTKNNKPFFASNNYMAKELGKSTSVISHSISRLLKLGIIENKGNKFVRELYTIKDILNAKLEIESAENNISNVNNSIRSAENSILLDDLKPVLVKISNLKKLKSAIESAENSNILLSILISYTNKEYNSIDNSQKFKEFYKLYPVKKSPKKAEVTFARVLKEVTFEEVMTGLKNYLAHIEKKKIAPEYIKHPATWLNQQCWEDEYEPVKVETEAEKKNRERIERLTREEDEVHEMVMANQRAEWDRQAKARASHE